MLRALSNALTVFTLAAMPKTAKVETMLADFATGRLPGSVSPS
jgi:hypothetical protein